MRECLNALGDDVQITIRRHKSKGSFAAGEKALNGVKTAVQALAVFQGLRTLQGWIEQTAAMRPDLVQKVRMLGPAVPPIEMVRRRHRRSLIFASADTGALRQLAQQFLTAFQKLPAEVRLKIDVDPQSLV